MVKIWVNQQIQTLLFQLNVDGGKPEPVLEGAGVGPEVRDQGLPDDQRGPDAVLYRGVDDPVVRIT